MTEPPQHTPRHDHLWGSRRFLETILGSVREAITVQDPTGRIVYANQEAADLIGFPSIEALLRADVSELMSRYEFLKEDGTPLPSERIPGQQVLAGERSDSLVVGYRRDDDPTVHWSMVRADGVYDDDGTLLWVVNVFQDITPDRREQERRALLAEVNTVLGSSLDFERTLADLADLVVPRIADWCAVDLLEQGDRIRPLALAHVDPEKLELVTRYRQRNRIDPESDRMSSRVLRSGHSELIQEISRELEGELEESDPAAAELLRQLDLRSVAVVPLAAMDRTLGVLSVATSESGRKLSEWHLSLLEEIGHRAGQALENARLFQHQREAARALQSSLLPADLPTLPGASLAARYHPLAEGSEVGGDFYDGFAAGDGWALVVGDVQGKGPKAASLVGLARHTVRAAARYEPAPPSVLMALNQALLEEKADLHCTAVYVLVRPQEPGYLVQLACAGHPPPVILRAGGALQLLECSGTLLGAYQEIQLSEAKAQLEIGDSLVLYTDGVEISRQAPGKSLTEILSGVGNGSSEDLAQRIEAAVTQAHPGGLDDDLALLVLRVAGEQA